MSKILVMPTASVRNHAELLQLWTDLSNPWPVQSASLRVVFLGADAKPWKRTLDLPLTADELPSEIDRLVSEIDLIARDVVSGGSIAVCWQAADIDEPSLADRSALSEFAQALASAGWDHWPIGLRHLGRTELLS